MSSTTARTHFPPTALDAQHKIDEEISRLEAQLLALKLKRNTLSPISQLHPEILLEIFLLVRTSSKKYSRGKASLRLTWVSHAWRELALNTSNLWALIDFHHPEWLQEAVSRTRERQLDFDLDFNRAANWSNFHSLGPPYFLYLSRAKTLEIHSIMQVSFPGPLYLEAIPDWKTPAPALVELILYCVALPRKVFSGICPSLRKLHLASCRIDWETLPDLTGLKELRITFPAEGTTFDCLIDILQSTAPTLEQLALVYVEIDPESISVDPDRLQLNNLKSLSLSGDAEKTDTIEALLDQISLPRHTSTQIGAPWELSIFEALSLSQDTSGWETDRLEVSNDGHNPLTLRVRKVGRMDHSTDSNSLADMTTLNPQPPSIDNPHLQTIGSEFFFDYDEDMDFLEYFANVGTIRELRFDILFRKNFEDYIDTQIKELCKIFGEGTHPTDTLHHADISRGRCVVSFHKLQVLNLCGLESLELTLQITLDDYRVRVLPTWLGWRKALGLQLNKLIFSDMVIESVSWAHQLFDEVVDSVEFVNVRERNLGKAEDEDEDEREELVEEDESGEEEASDGTGDSEAESGDGTAETDELESGEE